MSACTLNGVLAALGTLVLIAGIGVLVYWLAGDILRSPRIHSHQLILMTVGPVLALALAAGAGALAASRCGAATAAGCPDPDVLAARNLLANAALAAGPTAPGTPDSPLPSWVVSGTLSAGNPSGWTAPAAGSDLYAARVRVRAGANYCFQVDLDGSGHGQALVLWDDATLKQIGYDGPAPQRANATIRASATAPPGASYARLLLRATDGAPLFRAPALAGTGVRIEPWPNGAKAALAFSFDWESAMGGLIHSKSQHDRDYAVVRGLNMRAGADTLLDVFQQAKMEATFYATGYNLLDGNADHQQFVSNPTYKWGPAQGWATTWWLTNTWYSDDPYGTVAGDPAWYFGDQTRRLYAAGQEIGSHTFGHLYVRGATPAQLSADLDEWIARYDALGFQAAHSFAFPWQSSNSLTPDFYQVFARHGFDSVTRIYPPDLCRNPLVCDRYVVQAAPVYSPVLVMPDFQLGASGPDLTDSGPTVVTSTLAAQAVIGETIARRGATSFWNHPEIVTIPAVRDTWQETIAAAAKARDRGDLWIAPVGDIARYWRGIGMLDVKTTSTGIRLEMQVTNRAPYPLDGVTLSLPQPALSVTVDSRPGGQPRPGQVILPHMEPGQTVQVMADLEIAPP